LSSSRPRTCLPLALALASTRSLSHGVERALALRSASQVERARGRRASISRAVVALRRNSEHPFKTMSALFPRRMSQRDWLAEYALLKDDDEENGIDLVGQRDSDDDDEVGDEQEQDLEDLIDKNALELPHDEERLKALDAARRDEEDRALRDLARRFELRADEYVDDAPSRYVRMGPTNAQATAERAAKEAARVEHEVAAAQKKMVEEERKALYALYDLQSEGEDCTAPQPTTGKRKAASGTQDEAEATEGRKDAAAPSRRYRIKKKASHHLP